jgi:hypothetical protein
VSSPSTSPELSRRSFLIAAGALFAILRAPVKPPTAITGAATGIGATAATLNGSVNPRGSATAASFDWGLTTSYGNTTPGIPVGAGNKAVSVSTPIGGLAPGTVYHFRIRATSPAGTALGADAAFTTPTAPPPAGSAFRVGVSSAGGPDLVGGAT